MKGLRQLAGTFQTVNEEIVQVFFFLQERGKIEDVVYEHIPDSVE